MRRFSIANPQQELEKFDVAFLAVCIILIFLGSCGVLANGRGFCLFFHQSTVRLQLRTFPFSQIENTQNVYVKLII